jgi:hypothetical protein
VDEVFDGIAEGGGEGVGGDVEAFGAGASLDADGGFVVVGGDGAFRAFEDEAALGLGLMGPWVGERAPAGFEAAETEGVAGDGDAVFVDFEALGGGGDAGDLVRGDAVEEPCGDGCAVAEVIEERAAAFGGLVEPCWRPCRRWTVPFRFCQRRGRAGRGCRRSSGLRRACR